MAFDWTTNKMFSLPPNSRGQSGIVAFTSGSTVSVPTKMTKIICGIGVCENDGLIAYATAGKTSNGVVTFTRVGSIETAADNLHYFLVGY